MQSVYWFCLSIGGAFVALSMMGGGDLLGDADFDADVDADFDADLDAGFDADFEADIDADLAADVAGDIDAGDIDAGGDLQVDTDVALLRSPRRQRLPGWLSIPLSFKFWTFGGCFFGLTGVLLGVLEPALAATTVFAIALTIGILCGALLVGSLRGLKSRQVNSLVRNEDFAGLLGTVEIPFDANSKGKVLLEVGGSTLHLVAQTDEEKAFKAGEPVLVVGRTQNRLWVVSAKNALEQPGDVNSSP